MKNYSDEEARQLVEQTKQNLLSAPRITKAVYNQGQMHIDVGVISLGTTITMTISLARCLPQLAKVAEEDLRQFKVTPSGGALMWSTLGTGITVESLLEVALGLSTTNRSTVASGKKGGSARSEAKTAAVRDNGKKGGRPRKAVAS